MYPIVRVSFGVVVSCVLLILAANVSGFFVSPSDDPAWVDVAVADAGGGTGNGPGGPGLAVYQRVCQSCHQATGNGLEGVYPPLAGSEWAQGDPAIPVRLVLHGFQGAIERNGVKYSGVMAAWGEVLDDQEIADVLNFVRASWGNSGAPVAADYVAEVRAATANKLGAYQPDEVLAEATASASGGDSAGQ